ncbi:MAG: hypothetical protein ACTSW1_00625 [Candidatus Hodarchaeales archaeon]
MLKWLFKKEREVEYELPRKYILTKPIPQGDSRGVSEKFVELATGRGRKEFPIADPVLVEMFKQMGYPHFDITVGKKVKHMVLRVGGLKG